MTCSILMREASRRGVKESVDETFDSRPTIVELVIWCPGVFGSSMRFIHRPPMSNLSTLFGTFFSSHDTLFEDSSKPLKICKLDSFPMWRAIALQSGMVVIGRSTSHCGWAILAYTTTLLSPRAAYLAHHVRTAFCSPSSGQTQSSHRLVHRRSLGDSKLLPALAYVWLAVQTQPCSSAALAGHRTVLV